MVGFYTYAGVCDGERDDEPSVIHTALAALCLRVTCVSSLHSHTPTWWQLSSVRCLSVTAVSSNHTICRETYSSIYSGLLHPQVFEAMIAWIKHDKEARLEHMPKLMEHVRLPLLSRDYLVQVWLLTVFHSELSIFVAIAFLVFFKHYF